MLRICASVNSLEELQNAKGADLMEVDIGTFRQMTEMPEMPVIVKVSTMEEVAEMLSKKWDGYLDIGELPRPETNIPVISSIHDDVRTMSSQEIIDRMNAFDSEVAIGFFMVNRPADLVAIHDASPFIQKKHAIDDPQSIGMEYGKGNGYYFMFTENDTTGTYIKDNSALLAKVEYEEGQGDAAIKGISYYKISARRST